MNVKRFCIKKFSGLKRPDLGLFLRKNDKIDSARLIFAVESDKGKQTRMSSSAAKSPCLPTGKNVCLLAKKDL